MIELILLLLVLILAFCLATFLFKARPVKSGSAERNKPIYYSAENAVRFLKLAPNINAVLSSAATIMTYDQIPARMPYESSKDIIKTTLHNGQLKLFLTELEFLTEYTDGTPAICVYAGSAPSNKINFLAGMFPTVKFILIDPHEHYIMFPGNEDQYASVNISKCLYFRAMQTPKFAPKNAKVQTWAGGASTIIPREECIAGLPENISEIILTTPFQFYIYEDFYTNDVSRILKTIQGRVLFVSDIRSQFESSELPRSIDILWNSAMMYNWLDILQPAAFMLKFRCPYSITDRDIAEIKRDYATATYMHADFDKCKIKFLDNFAAKKFEYIDAAVYMQAFAGPTSTESRLVGTNLTTKLWDCEEYNDKFFYYNRVHRPYGWHTSHEKHLDLKIGIDRCGDCAVMCGIFDNYFAKFNKSNETKKYIKTLLNHIHRSLHDTNFIHGAYNKQETPETILTLPMVDNEANATITLFKDRPKFKPMTIADAYRCYRIFAENSRTASTIEFALFGYYDIDNQALENYISNTFNFVASGLKYNKIAAEYKKIRAPDSSIVVTDDEIKYGDITMPLPYDTKNLSPERLFISIAGCPSIMDYRVMDIIDDRFGNHIVKQALKLQVDNITIITSTPLQTIYTPETDIPINYYNTQEDNLVKLDLTNKNTMYIYYTACMPRVIQHWCKIKFNISYGPSTMLFPKYHGPTRPYRQFALGTTILMKTKNYAGEETINLMEQVTNNMDYYE